MAEANVETDAKAAPPAKKKKNPMLMIGIIAGAVVALTAGSFLVVTKLMSPAGASPEAGEGDGGGGHGGGGHGGGGHGEASSGARFEIKDLVMNSADQGVPRFVKVSLTFETKGARTVQQLTDQDYKVRDLLIRLVGSRTVAELSVPDAREHLRMEIMDELNSTTAQGGIVNIYFTDYIVQ